MTSLQVENLRGFGGIPCAELARLEVGRCGLRDLGFKRQSLFQRRSPLDMFESSCPNLIIGNAESLCGLEKRPSRSTGMEAIFCATEKSAPGNEASAEGISGSA